MSETTLIRVRVCMDCGETGSSMDTVCPSCQRRGTLRERYQCTKCRQLNDEPSCLICSQQMAFREGPAIAPPRVVESWQATDVSQPDPPAWAVGAVGGAIFGVVAGAVAALFLAESWLVGAAIGLLPGIVIGAVLTRNNREPR